MGFQERDQAGGELILIYGSWFMSPLLWMPPQFEWIFLYTGHVPALPTLAEPFTGWLWSTAEQGAASNCHWSRAWVQAGESKVSVKIGKVIRTALVKIWIFQRVLSHVPCPFSLILVLLVFMLLDFVKQPMKSFFVMVMATVMSRQQWCWCKHSTHWYSLTPRALMRLGQQSEAKVECSTVSNHCQPLISLSRMSGTAWEI